MHLRLQGASSARPSCRQGRDLACLNCFWFAAYDQHDDLDIAAAEAGAPATFFCPISYAVLRDPVLLSTGQT